MFYLVRMPRLVQQYYDECLWKVKTFEKKLYLTFDDGPVPGPTEFILEQLDHFGAKATFFNVGAQVEKFPDLHDRVVREGHIAGNHTFSHLNGWRTDTQKYLDDIDKASEVIDSPYFRPPYGRITKFQLCHLVHGKKYQLRPVMWHVLSGDFDPKISPGQCYLNVIRYTVPGSIIVFHDSTKTFSIVRSVLPRILAYYREKNYVFETIDQYYNAEKP